MNWGKTVRPSGPVFKNYDINKDEIQFVVKYPIGKLRKFSGIVIGVQR